MQERFRLTGYNEILFEQIEGILRQNQVEDFLIRELRPGGLGNDMWKEADEHNGKVSIANFLTWLYVE